MSRMQVRNQAMKQGCASYQLDGAKQTLFMVRTVVDTVVYVGYIVMQIFVTLFRLLIPTGSATVFGEIMAELDFWFNKLVLVMVDSIKQLANMLFNLIFSTGPLGLVMKTIVQWLCKTMSFILWVWNETGKCCPKKVYGLE